MSSSTTRTSTLIIGVPTEPILRTASCPRRVVVTGLHSVCPNELTISASGKLALNVRSRPVEAGAAPHPHLRSAERSRSRAPTRSQIAAHCAGTKKHDVTRSRSRTASASSGSNPPDGGMTVVPPANSDGRKPATPAMWNSGVPESQTLGPPGPPRCMVDENACR